MMSAGNMSYLGFRVTKIEYVGLKQGPVNCGPQTKYGLQPVFINKFIGDSHAHLLLNCLWLHSYYNSRIK